MKKWLVFFTCISLLVVLLGALLGCQQRPSTYEEFLIKPNQAMRMLHRCRLSRDNASTSEQSCQAALRASLIIQELVAELRENQLAYGQKILRLQMQLGEVQQALQRLLNASPGQGSVGSTTPQSIVSLRLQAASLSLQIKSRLAVLRLVQTS